ncbi:E3 ubiquitin-protein ligase RING1-like [Nymphaea thermarum]|nr:E3 ubiquitin-protein ligase RING1-like [Nymphaea thermarum]
MLRTTVRTSCHSFTVVSLPRLEGPETPSEMVHLQFEIRLCSETAGEGGREEGSMEPAATVHDFLSSLTSSFVVNRSSLRSQQQISEQIQQHFSNLECEWLLLPVDQVSGELFNLIQQRTRLNVLRPEESLVVVSSTTVTYHVRFIEEYRSEDVEGSADDIEEYLEELGLNDQNDVLEDQSAVGDSLEQVPASRASVDALERRKVEEQEENAQINTCAVCQYGVSRGDSVAKMPCSHEFHEDCISAWLERAHSCPLCRLELPTDD